MSKVVLVICSCLVGVKSRVALKLWGKSPLPGSYLGSNPTDILYYSARLSLDWISCVLTAVVWWLVRSQGKANVREAPLLPLGWGVRLGGFSLPGFVPLCYFLLLLCCLLSLLSSLSLSPSIQGRHLLVTLVAKSIWVRPVGRLPWQLKRGM